MDKRKIVLVTGLSGAGKTSAMAVLEDLGYHCLDRFPVFLLEELIHEISRGYDPRYDTLALSVSSVDFKDFYNAFSNIDCDLRVLFLFASKEQLLLRYKYNRRNHPLLISHLANGLEEAIGIEIKEFSRIKDYATIIIDTSFLKQQDLTARIQDVFSFTQKPTLAISFISFGYRYGLPLDADLVFDVRFLKNPYWDPELRKKSGNDNDVFAYVINDPTTQDFISRIRDFLDYAFVQYQQESKSHLTVGIGCTGGQHRSVSLVNYLFNAYKDDYTCFMDHRDVVENAHD